MKTLTAKILVSGLLLVSIQGTTALRAGNTTSTVSTAIVAIPTISTEDVITYLAQLGIKAVSVSPTQAGSNSTIVTTSTGAHIIVYTSGNQIIGHEDLPY
jgi:hypothetical protein